MDRVFARTSNPFMILIQKDDETPDCCNTVYNYLITLITPARSVDNFLMPIELTTSSMGSTIVAWKLKPIEGFRFLWKGLQVASPFHNHPGHIKTKALIEYKRITTLHRPQRWTEKSSLSIVGQGLARELRLWHSCFKLNRGASNLAVRHSTL